MDNDARLLGESEALRAPLRDPEGLAERVRSLDADQLADSLPKAVGLVEAQVDSVAIDVLLALLLRLASSEAEAAGELETEALTELLEAPEPLAFPLAVLAAVPLREALPQAEELGKAVAAVLKLAKEAEGEPEEPVDALANEAEALRVPSPLFDALPVLLTRTEGLGV